MVRGGARLSGAVLATCLGLAMQAGAQTGAAPQDAEPDFHAIWEARCLSCHGHAGAFARERLTLEAGEVRGRGGRDLRPFLARHGGGLPPDQVELFLDVLARQLASGGFYERECRICHDSARELARLRLVLRDGRLMGRYSGREIATFLVGHGRMSEAEAEAMTEALAAILKGAR
ncbi:hypothetical protein M1105_15500 [Limibaculum sp. FT325]|uniref:hypothetical protein n=1 Tax=Thermohalobaculum sediminis TaxID=2939436 RepID=UPI0020BDE578|nr:hypothetical protein [Limibaculum sediminis]MCL5778385.1 hypothetical protein [Limibaculum sediminis]